LPANVESMSARCPGTGKGSISGDWDQAAIGGSRVS
jgi:hypothetical protein